MLLSKSLRIIKHIISVLFKLGELAEAEDALSEANILNNSDPEVWGYLSLVCLKTGRQLEAEQAYKYAIKVNVDSFVYFVFLSPTILFTV